MFKPKKKASETSLTRVAIEPTAMTAGASRVNLLRRFIWGLLRPEMIRAFEESADHGRGDPEEDEHRRRLKLRAVISDAASTIPFYREHWGGRGVLGAAERGDLDLADLPTLRREHLREGLQRLERPSQHLDKVIRRSTGGSSGEPVRFTQSRGYVARASGRGLRALSWGGWFLGAKTALVWGGPTEVEYWQGVRGHLKSRVTNHRLYDAFRAGTDAYGQWVVEWRRWRPRFVLGYASALEDVSRYMLDHGEEVEGVQAVFSTAEKLHEEQRGIIERAFGAPVRDQYGSREVLSVASECTSGRLHAYQDSAYVELLPGLADARQIALTQFDNPAMPLIRYLNGDLALWADSQSRCACGLSYPALSKIIGRTTDLFRLADGLVVHGEYFTHLMYDVEGAHSFQFHQAADGRIRLYVVPESGVDGGTLLDRLQSVMEPVSDALGTQIQFDIELVTDIPKRGEGKHRFTISEVAKNG